MKRLTPIAPEPLFGPVDLLAIGLLALALMVILLMLFRRHSRLSARLAPAHDARAGLMAVALRGRSGPGAERPEAGPAKGGAPLLSSAAPTPDEGPPDAARPPPEARTFDKSRLADPAYQQQAVSMAFFRKRRMLNHEEAGLLPVLERAVRRYGNGHRLMCQICLSELIRPESANPAICKAAFHSINAKRLDFAIIDRGGFLVAGIEYQGSGHHQKSAFMRDAVKREAVRKAGAKMLEYEPGWTEAAVVRDIQALLGARQRQAAG